MAISRGVKILNPYFYKKPLRQETSVYKYDTLQCQKSRETTLVYASRNHTKIYEKEFTILQFSSLPKAHEYMAKLKAYS